jgi:hypothetical protein
VCLLIEHREIPIRQRAITRTGPFYTPICLLKTAPRGRHKPHCVVACVVGVSVTEHASVDKLDSVACEGDSARSALETPSVVHDVVDHHPSGHGCSSPALSTAGAECGAPCMDHRCSLSCQRRHTCRGPCAREKSG